MHDRVSNTGQDSIVACMVASYCFTVTQSNAISNSHKHQDDDIAISYFTRTCRQP